MPSLTQRWADRVPTWRPVHDGGFNAKNYDVVELDEPTARGFVARHHYAPTLPSTTYRYGLINNGGVEPQLVGVATLGVPMSRGSLTNVFPTLEPYTEALDFNRLVVLSHIPSNADSAQ